MSKNSNITDKMVLGTAQFGMDYGIANIDGKPSKKNVYNILSHAWENGVVRFDTAPGYNSECLLGQFISTNGLQNRVKVLTKISSLDGLNDHETVIMKSIESSIKNLGCPIDVLFFHNPNDSLLLLKFPEFFDDLIKKYPISSLGVSVYDPNEVLELSSHTDLAFQFPLNVLDRRFEQVLMPEGKRYARSVFLQGLLASPKQLRLNSPKSLRYFQKKYHQKLNESNLNSIAFALSYVAQSEIVDYFLFGVDTEEQIKEFMNLKPLNECDVLLDKLIEEMREKDLLDPRKWN